MVAKCGGWLYADMYAYEVSFNAVSPALLFLSVTKVKYVENDIFGL